MERNEENALRRFREHLAIMEMSSEEVKEMALGWIVHEPCCSEPISMKVCAIWHTDPLYDDISYLCEADLDEVDLHPHRHILPLQVIRSSDFRRFRNNIIEPLETTPDQFGTP